MNIVIRTDASVAIGSGHVMRCLSLADVLRNHGACVQFICRLHDGNLCALIRERGFAVHPLAKPANVPKSKGYSDYSPGLGSTWQYDATETIAAVRRLGARPDWLIVDHYGLSANWEGELRDSVGRIMVIDDLADRMHDCDLLLDQNLYDNADARYSGKVPESCQSLIGPRFSLLREEFSAARAGLLERSGSVRRILVFFGGVDHENYTEVAIHALDGIRHSDFGVDVVVGEKNCRRSQIQSECKSRNFKFHVQSDRMAELMTEADIGIGAGGSTTWERCCVGLPCLTFSIAGNQTLLVSHAARAGILNAPDVDPGDSDAVAAQLQAFIDNPLLRESMSRRSMSVVDGYGADRVRRAIGVSSVTIRFAKDDDSEQIFGWRNSAAVRDSSLNSAPIDWTTHREWFDSVLADADRLMLIGESKGQSVGVVRFDVSGDTASLSIYLVPDQMNRGLGTELLFAAEQWLKDARPDLYFLRAEVLAVNKKSHRLFIEAGYDARPTEYIKRIK